MNSLLTLDHFLVQTPSPLRPLTLLTPQLVIAHTAHTLPHRVLLMEEVLHMQPMEVVAVILVVTEDPLVVTHHLAMVLHQEVLETMEFQATAAVTVSKN